MRVQHVNRAFVHSVCVQAHAHVHVHAHALCLRGSTCTCTNGAAHPAWLRPARQVSCPTSPARMARAYLGCSSTLTPPIIIRGPGRATQACCVSQRLRGPYVPFHPKHHEGCGVEQFRQFGGMRPAVSRPCPVRLLRLRAATPPPCRPWCAWCAAARGHPSGKLFCAKCAGCSGDCSGGCSMVQRCAHTPGTVAAGWGRLGSHSRNSHRHGYAMQLSCA